MPLPTEDDLAAYLKEHQTEFRTKETRTVDLLALSPEVLASTKTISEDEISAEYERTKDSLVKIEKRTIKQIALTTPEQQKAFEDGKAAGKGIGESAGRLRASRSPIWAPWPRPRSPTRASRIRPSACLLMATRSSKALAASASITVSAITPGGQVTLGRGA